MNPLEELVSKEESSLTRGARAAISGLAHTLDNLLRAFPNDPAAHRARAAVSYLNSLALRGVARESPSEGMPVAGSAEAYSKHPTPSDTSRSPSELLLQTWSRTKEWDRWIGRLKETSLEDLPRLLWLVTHRLPAETAKKWQEEWVATFKPSMSEKTAIAIAGPLDRLLCPPLPRGTPAVRMDPTVPLEGHLAAESSAYPIAHHMARVVSAILWFLENDPALEHAWSSLNRFGVSSVSEANRIRYRDALLQRLEYVRQAEQENNCKSLLIAWADLDEGIHSLLFEPLPHPESTFSLVAKASRDCIALLHQRAAQAQVAWHVRVPSGSYSQSCGLSNPMSDVELQSGGAPGDIVRCLRVYSKIDKTTYPARLAYRPHGKA